MPTPEPPHPFDRRPGWLDRVPSPHEGVATAVVVAAIGLVVSAVRLLRSSGTDMHDHLSEVRWTLAAVLAIAVVLVFAGAFGYALLFKHRVRVGAGLRSLRRRMIAALPRFVPRRREDRSPAEPPTTTYAASPFEADRPYLAPPADRRLPSARPTGRARGR